MVGQVVVVASFEEVGGSAARVDEAVVVCVWVCGFGILSLTCQLVLQDADIVLDLYWKLDLYIDYVYSDPRLFQAG